MEENSKKVKRKAGAKITLSIGGTIFVTTRETLDKFPGTKLSKLTKSSPSFNQETQEHFFDRDPIAFSCILNYYRTGELHIPTNLCGNALRIEMEFWEVKERLVAECCLTHLLETDQGRAVIRTLHSKLKMNELTKDSLSAWALWKKRVWFILDKPNSSRAAKMWNTIFMLFILTSATTFCIESLPGARVARRMNTSHKPNSEMQKRLMMNMNTSNDKLKLFLETEPNQLMFYLELICLIVFSNELFLHFLTCPRKAKFFKKFLNWIDVITVVMGWLVFALEESIEFGYFVLTFKVYMIFLVVKSLSILRLFRFFRLAERFTGLKVMMLAIKASCAELALLMFCIIVLATMFGSFGFFCEFDNNHFDSIPTSIWWALVTMTTVGYGDYYPETYCGRGIGTLCALCGLLILAMPIAVIATNFNEYYSRNLCREKRIQLNLQEQMLAENAFPDNRKHKT